jgi:hypothetical protein
MSRQRLAPPRSLEETISGRWGRAGADHRLLGAHALDEVSRREEELPRQGGDRRRREVGREPLGCRHVALGSSCGFHMTSQRWPSGSRK